MRSWIRQNALIALSTAVGLSLLAWLGLTGFAWNDYDLEAAPALGALSHDDLNGFLSLLPAYGGSLILRMPFALLPKLWGGGELAVYRMLALPCLMAAGAFGLWLQTRMRLSGQGRLARGTALGLCVASPIAYRALDLGHPEELLCAVLCVSAVFAARGRHPNWAGLLLGLALATKPWALVAAPPVLLALEANRLRAVVVSIALTATILVPIAIPRASNFATVSRHAANSGGIFQPWQLWWWTGRHGSIVRGNNGKPKPGYRAAPSWIGSFPHPLILALSPLLALLWRRRSRAPDDVLLLLALLLLLRCVLDPWNNVYYSLGFLFAVLGWEVQTRRQPLLALSSTAALWVLFEELPRRISPDSQSAAYLAWAVPMTALIALRLYAPERFEKLATSLAAGLPRASTTRSQGAA